MPATNGLFWVEVIRMPASHIESTGKTDPPGLYASRKVVLAEPSRGGYPKRPRKWFIISDLARPESELT